VKLFEQVQMLSYLVKEFTAHQNRGSLHKGKVISGPKDIEVL